MVSGGGASHLGIPGYTAATAAGSSPLASTLPSGYGAAPSGSGSIATSAAQTGAAGAPGVAIFTEYLFT